MKKAHLKRFVIAIIDISPEEWQGRRNNKRLIIKSRLSKTFLLSFVDVIGCSSVLLKILEPLSDCICTKFKGKRAAAGRVRVCVTIAYESLSQSNGRRVKTLPSSSANASSRNGTSFRARWDRISI